MASFRGVDLSLPAFNAPAGYRGDMIYRDPHARTLIEMMMQKMESDQQYADAENQRSAERWNMAANLPTQLYGTVAGLKEQKRLEDIAEREMRVAEEKARQESAYRGGMLRSARLTNQAEQQEEDVTAFENLVGRLTEESGTRGERRDKVEGTLRDIMAGNIPYDAQAHYGNQPLDRETVLGMWERPDQAPVGPYVGADVLELSLTGPSQQRTGETEDGQLLYGTQTRSLTPPQVLPTSTEIETINSWEVDPESEKQLEATLEQLQDHDLDPDSRDRLSSLYKTLSNKPRVPQVLQREKKVWPDGEIEVGELVDTGRFHADVSQPGPQDLFRDPAGKLHYLTKGDPVPDGWELLSAYTAQNIADTAAAQEEANATPRYANYDEQREHRVGLANQFSRNLRPPRHTLLSVLGTSERSMLQDAIGGGLLSPALQLGGDWWGELSPEIASAVRNMRANSMRLVEAFRTHGGRLTNSERQMLEEKLTALDTGMFKDAETLLAAQRDLRDTLYNVAENALLGVADETRLSYRDMSPGQQTGISEWYRLVNTMDSFLVSVGLPPVYAEVENQIGWGDAKKGVLEKLAQPGVKQ
jgi:hypothetical protein